MQNSRKQFKNCSDASSRCMLEHHRGPLQEGRFWKIHQAPEVLGPRLRAVETVLPHKRSKLHWWDISTWQKVHWSRATTPWHTEPFWTGLCGVAATSSECNFVKLNCSADYKKSNSVLVLSLHLDWVSLHVEFLIPRFKNSTVRFLV